MLLLTRQLSRAWRCRPKNRNVSYPYSVVTLQSVHHSKQNHGQIQSSHFQPPILLSEYWGGGSGAWLASLGLSWGRATNVLICAPRLLLRAKVRDDSGPLFARCALLGLHWDTRQWRLGGARRCNWRCCWGEAEGGVGRATADTIAGHGVGGVEGQGTDNTVVDRAFGGYAVVRCEGR